MSVIPPFDTLFKTVGASVVGASGVDASVQKFYADLNYRDLTVYASNGRARNNIGAWNVKNILVGDKIKGFDFYKQKDFAMAENADIGFLIWNGESKGTLNNIINLLDMGKQSVVYLTSNKLLLNVDSEDKLKALLELCPNATKELYEKLTFKSYNQASLI
ncbi:hypothetical protein FACS1894219_06470 [Clostridia bacterium]|nr:hypothetical protein FACS1894219_06470 [Clostridia bacterium]